MPPEPGKSRSARKQPPGRSGVRECSHDGGAGGRGGSQPPLSPPAESTSSRTTGESRRYPPGDVSPQDAESAKKDAEGEEEGGMGRRGNTSTDPFPLRTQRHSQAMLQTRLREDRQAHPQQSAPFPGVLSPGRHCSNEQSRSQWRAKKYFSSKVSHVSNSLLNNYYVPGISTQINEMLRSPGLPGAHDFIRETGHVLKS